MNVTYVAHVMANQYESPVNLFVLPSLPPLNMRLSVPRARALIFRRADADDFRRSVCTTSFVRLSDHAVHEYKLACDEATAYRESRVNDLVDIGAAMRTVAHLETATTALHRALCFLGRLTTYPDVQKVIAGKQIAKGRTRDTLRSLRSAIQHLDDRLCQEDFPRELPIMLIAQAGMLEVEEQRIPLADFVHWLTEVQSVAATLVRQEAP